MLIVDTGPLVAAADRSDRHHSACAELLETATGPLVTTAMVIAEAAYLVARELGGHAEPAIYDAIADGTLIVEPLTVEDWQRIRELVERYADLPLGGTDASLIAIAERLGATRVATLDRTHFHVIRPAHCDTFELVPWTTPSSHDAGRDDGLVDLDWLTDRERSNTLYLVAPLDDRKRLAPVLGGLLGGLTDQAYHLTIAHHANLAARQAAGLGKGS